MTRSQAIKLTAILGLVAGGLWLIHKPASPQTTPGETSAETDPAFARSERSRPVQPPPIAPAFWQEKLHSIHAGTNELFGVPGEQRMKELQTFVESLAAVNLPDAAAKLAGLQMQNPTEAGRDLQLRLVRRWAESDARAAAAWAAETPGAIHHEALAATAGVWASQNFAEAAAWAGTLPAGDDRRIALLSIANEAVYSDPTAALKLAAQLPADAARDELIQQAVGTWTVRAPAEAVSWAQKVPDETLRQQAISAIAVAWGESDPVSAATLAIDSLPPGAMQDQAVIAIVQRWGLNDPKAAAEWVAQFPEGNLRQLASDTLAANARRGTGAVKRPGNAGVARQDAGAPGDHCRYFKTASVRERTWSLS